MMLIGEYLGKIADKNRIALPKKFRDELSDNLIVTRGYEKCLIVLNDKKWRNLLNVIESKPFLNKSVRDTKRFIAGGASEVELDGQGRFILSEMQKKYAGLLVEVVFVGILDWVEIWSKDSWEKKLASLEIHAGEIAEKLLN